MRYQGKITSWKDDQGFGFITPNVGGNQVFVHIKSFLNRQRRPVGNEIVTYEIKTDMNGRSKAENVVFIGDRAAEKYSSKRSVVLLMLATFFLVFVAVSVSLGKLPFTILALYLGTSVIAFFAYAFDKSAARNDRWRTQESTLHMFGLIGGWPGALIAQQLLRHKSKKKSFQIVFWITVVANCGFLSWFLLPSGSSTLRSIINVFNQLAAT